MKKFYLSLLALAMLLFVSINSMGQYLNEGFESGSLPAGWTEEFVTGTTSWAYQTGDNNAIDVAHGGTMNAIFYYGSSTAKVTKLVTPPMDLSTANSPELTFWHAQDDWSGDQDELRVYYKTFSGDSWSLIPGATFTSNITGWTKETFSLPSQSATYYIAFEGTGQYGYGVILDDIRVSDMVTCPEPTNGFATGMTTNSALLNWTENGTATLWNIELGLKNFSPTGVPTQTGVTNPYTYSSLNASTSYDFYVQADCGGGDESFWAGPYNFNTTCTPISTFPWTEDFNNGGDVPVCWENEASNTWDWVFNTSSDHTTGTGYNAEFDAYDATTDDVGGLLSPVFDLSGTTSPALKFWWRRYDSEDNEAELKIDIYANGSWHYNVHPGLLQTNYSWTQETVYLSAYKYNDVRIRFSVTVINWYDQSFILDDVSIEESGVTCVPPSALYASSIMGTSAELNWTENNGSTSWNIEYGPSGFTQGTGTSLSVSTNPYLLSGLSQTTVYDFYLQTDCGGAVTSLWSGPFTFTTTCNAVASFPWSEDFENSGNIPLCWENEPDNGYDWEFVNYIYDFSGNAIYDGHGDVQNGNQYFAVFDSYNSNANDIGKLTSAPVDLTMSTNPELHFWLNKPYSTDTARLHLRININANYTWYYDVMPTIDATSASSPGWVEFTYSLVSFQASDFLRIQFEAECHNWSSSIIGLDDVEIVAGTVTGIEEANNNLATGIFPNPSSGSFQLRTNADVVDIKEVEVYNLLGEIVMKTKPRIIGTGIFALDLKNMNEGMYYLTYVSNNKKYSEKFIVK